jgi:hypothetical protein
MPRFQSNQSRHSILRFRNKQTIAMEGLWRPAWAFGLGSSELPAAVIGDAFCC